MHVTNHNIILSSPPYAIINDVKTDLTTNELKNLSSSALIERLEKEQQYLAELHCESDAERKKLLASHLQNLVSVHSLLKFAME